MSDLYLNTFLHGVLRELFYNLTFVILMFILWNLAQIISTKKTFKKVLWHYHLNRNLCWHQQKRCLPSFCYIFSQFHIKPMIIFLLSNNARLLLFFKISYAIRLTGISFCKKKSNKFFFWKASAYIKSESHKKRIT